MFPETPTAEQLGQIISHVDAPAFLLAAVAAYIALLISRMNRIIDRSQALNAIREDDTARVHLKADVPRLKRRAALLNKAVLFSTMCALVTTLMIIVAFAMAFIHARHEYGVALLFILSLTFLMLSLVNLARETHIALHDLDYHS